jgi:hypothetical protein
MTMTYPAVNPQWPLTKAFDLSVANIGAAGEVSFNLPPNAYLVDVSLEATTAFNTGGSGTVALTATDGTTTFVNAQSVKTTGIKTVAVAKKLFPTGGTITATITETLDTTAANAGRAVLVFSYVILGRTSEVQE